MDPCFSVKGSRTPRKVQGPTTIVGAPSPASGSVNPSGTNEVEGQARLESESPWSSLLHEMKASSNVPISAERGKGQCVEQPLIVSDEEGSEAGTSASVKELFPPNEDDDETKIEKLSLAFKQQKTVLCLWRDGTYRPVQVLEIKEQPAGCFKYYVHYTQFDRRNDDWVNLEQLKPDFTGPFVGNKADTQTRSGVMTRRQKRQMGIMEDHDELDSETLREHEALTKVKKINKIRLGKYQMETWYYSPFPPEYDDCEELLFCEFCLTFLKRESQLKRHMKKDCNLFFPPGKKIYSSGQLCVFEVDGTKQRVYAENLCYLAKLFLDHKSLLYETGAFLFYILCEEDVWGFHIVAYFSKEKFSADGNILACILTLPPYQKKGYGNFLIAFCKYAA